MFLLSSSCILSATKYKRLCLFGDLDKQVWLDSPPTVSRYETTGSDMMKSHCAYSSRRSFKQISTCNSPHPAMMCSPDSSMLQTTRGSDLASFFKPSTSFGRSFPSLGLTDFHNRRDTVLHIRNIVCVLNGGDCARLDDERINTYQRHSVSAGHIWDLLDCSAHH